MNVPDNRKTERIDLVAAIEYIYENTENYYGADVYNYSNGGMCIETGYSMRPGARIRIKIEESQKDKACLNVYNGCLAEVKWCDKMPGHEAFFYWVGVEFI